MKTRLIIFLAICILANPLKAQITCAKPEEFKLIKKKPLIVEQLQVDSKLIEKWEKKKGKAKNSETRNRYDDMIVEYEKFVNDYNANIKEAVEKCWDLNENVVYKTTSAVKKLRKESKRYAVLWFSETSTNKTDDYGFKYFPDLTIPTLNYSRIENGTVKVDYSFFMPYTGRREENEIKTGDLILALKLMKNQIAEIEKTGNKKYTFKKYAEDMGDKNCKELKGLKLIVPATAIHKSSNLGVINRAYKAGDVEKRSEEEITQMIENEEDVVVGFAIPYDIAAGSINVGVELSAARILCMRAFINVKTGKIYAVKGVDMGEFNDPFFRAKEFNKLGVCN